MTSSVLASRIATQEGDRPYEPIGRADRGRRQLLAIGRWGIDQCLVSVNGQLPLAWLYVLDTWVPWSSRFRRGPGRE